MKVFGAKVVNFKHPLMVGIVYNKDSLGYFFWKSERIGFRLRKYKKHSGLRTGFIRVCVCS
jgi:hypothetical protein